jgi:transposase-like protein
MQQGAKRRRQRRTDEEKQALLAAWRASGLSVREFSKREGVQKTCLWRWKRAEQSARDPSKGRTSISFAPVHIAKRETGAAVVAERVLVEVSVGADLRVRVYDGANVVEASRFVRALVGRSGC